MGTTWEGSLGDIGAGYNVGCGKGHEEKQERGTRREKEEKGGWAGAARLRVLARPNLQQGLCWGQLIQLCLVLSSIEPTPLAPILHPLAP